jgi:hypothetical protein
MLEKNKDDDESLLPKIADPTHAIPPKVILILMLCLISTSGFGSFYSYDMPEA